ncbi:hypothetical protein EMMF5_006360 [Cystobasidiomycetes sp. EMM_F5]
MHTEVSEILVEAHALNTTMTIGAWGACVRIDNTTNVYGPTSFCSKTAPGFNLFINMNETNHFYNWVSHIQKMMTALGAADVIDWQNTTRNYTTSNDILGINQPIGTVQAIKVVSASSTYYGFIHLIAALCLVAATASLIVPPRWISGGKSSLANFQRSGILTLILGAIGFIMTLVAFGCYFTFVSSTKSALNKINGISAGYSNSNVIWFLLPSAIVIIPAYLVILLPVYVKPADDDDESAPVNGQLNPLNHNTGYGQIGAGSSSPYSPVGYGNKDTDPLPGTPYGKPSMPFSTR